MEKLQARLQAASAEYQKIQNDLSVAVDSRQRLDSQLQENEMVKKVRRSLFSFLPYVTSRDNKNLWVSLGIRSVDSEE
jgi:hypothetical protein